jgi:DNA-binding NarL/FixJ family response regulator
MNPLNVFIADDHVVVREGLKALINRQSDMRVIGEAANGQEACDQVPHLHPDVVIMDLSMPGITGTQATARLSRECPSVKIVALTVHDNNGYILQLLSAGASGYVLKKSAGEGLIQAIRLVAEGKMYLDPEMAGKVVTGFVRRAADSLATEVPNLSDRELEIAKLTTAGHSNKEIASKLDISVKTVETYRARGMEKLGLTSRAQLVRYAIQQGWLSGEQN